MENKQSSNHLPDVGKKVSSVQQLVNSLIKLGYLHSNGFGQSLKVTEVINQANELHKEEITEAWQKGDGVNDKVAYKMSLEYYKDTFQ